MCGLTGNTPLMGYSIAIKLYCPACMRMVEEDTCLRKDYLNLKIIQCHHSQCIWRISPLLLKSFIIFRPQGFHFHPILTGTTPNKRKEMRGELLRDEEVHVGKDECHRALHFIISDHLRVAARENAIPYSPYTPLSRSSHIGKTRWG